MPKKVGAATVFLAGKLDDRTAPYAVPMKVVEELINCKYERLIG